MGHIFPGDIVCAADSGLDAALSAGIRPDFVVGDMDSVSDTDLLDQFPADAVEVYPQDKDCTDTELGLALLKKKDCCPIIMVGGGEGRLDHTLNLIKLFEGNIYPDFWYTGQESVQLIQGKFSATGEPGDSIAFYPVGTGHRDVQSQGLRWELNTVDWTKGVMSLSNRFMDRKIQIDVLAGKFLVIRSY